MSKYPAPKPIFDNLDNLDQLANPFKQTSFSVDEFLDISRAIPKVPIDYEYGWKFIWSYNGSPATFNAYRREIERLIQWAWHINNSSITDLKREDIETYIKFCTKPPVTWIGLKNVSRFKTIAGSRQVNPDWKPFVVTLPKKETQTITVADKKNFRLSQAAIQAIFSILSSFYNFLLQEEIVSSNPVALIRQKSKFLKKQQSQAPVRRISNLQWDYVIETVELLAKEDPNRYERSLFIMNCLYAMYLRISELVWDTRSEPVMSDFRKDGDGNWWFHVTGKGNKDRMITVSNDMLKALKHYRKHLGLSALPTSDDKTPLISKTLGSGALTSTRQVRILVQACFDRAYERMIDDGLAEDAAELKSATVHWLRHTGISEDVKSRPREHVRDDAGHANMQTTDRYIESDLRERHASGKHKRVKEYS